MEDRAILLKIRREFTQDEAVQSLLKMVAELEFEVGELKSENEELKHGIEQAKRLSESGELKTKKAWSKDELIADYEQRLSKIGAKSKEYKDEMILWRNKYFSLLAKTSNTTA